MSKAPATYSELVTWATKEITEGLLAGRTLADTVDSSLRHALTWHSERNQNHVTATVTEDMIEAFVKSVMPEARWPYRDPDQTEEVKRNVTAAIKAVAAAQPPISPDAVERIALDHANLDWVNDYPQAVGSVIRAALEAPKTANPEPPRVPQDVLDLLQVYGNDRADCRLAVESLQDLIRALRAWGAQLQRS